MRKWQVIVAIVGVAGAAWAGWDEARSKADEARRKGDETHKEFVQATKKIVGAMCNARDFEVLKDSGRSVASDVRSNVRDKLSEFHRATDEAISLLERIDSSDAHHGDVYSLENELKRNKEKLDERTYKIAEGSPDFIDEIVRKTEDARSDHKGRCSQHDFSADGERIRCMIKESDTCYVVVDAVDNSNGVSAARDKARRGVEHVKAELKKSSPGREVNGCVHVEARVDCLKVCPDVNDDGRVSSPSASWRERCDS